ncbi:unnamed protein product (mitochondrion) [Plasmodiophora brassicae]|uniref:ABC1 atypical kinase-like domain-containing protein n=1 Tax=Plasmodiophora brassicae TaxID=37360 RepID=A0A0G4J7V2_PLABS|nr:hypothetical protein PBRA_003229 [Plasmodiophora brassicae]SPQ95701.1 unnamed protein product [Plasmodiophora brassicae]
MQLLGTIRSTMRDFGGSVMSAVRASGGWVRMHPKLCTLICLTAVAVIVSTATVLLVPSGHQGSPMLKGTKKVGSSRSGVIARSLTAAGIVAGLTTAAYYRGWKRRQIRQPEQQTGRTTTGLAESLMSRKTAMKAAATVNEVVGLRKLDAVLVGGALALPAVAEFAWNRRGAVEAERNTSRVGVGIPFVQASDYMPAKQTRGKLVKLRQRYGNNTLFYILQQHMYNPLLVSDNMHLVQALLDAADESDFTAVDDLGRHTIWSFMDLAVDDLIMFQYYRPVLVALFDHRFVTPALLNAHDYYKITMLHQVMNEIRFPSQVPGRVEFLFDLVDMLLKPSSGNGADPGMPDSEGTTPTDILLDAIQRCNMSCPAGQDRLTALLGKLRGRGATDADPVRGESAVTNGTRYDAAMRVRRFVADVIDCHVFRGNIGDSEFAGCLRRVQRVPDDILSSETAARDAADGIPGLWTVLRHVASAPSVADDWAWYIDVLPVHRMVLRTKSQEAAIWAGPKIDPWQEMPRLLNTAKAHPLSPLIVDGYHQYVDKFSQFALMFEMMAGSGSPSWILKGRFLSALLRTELRADLYTTLSNVVMAGGPVIMKTMQECAARFLNKDMKAAARQFFDRIRPMSRADLIAQLHADFGDDTELGRVLPGFQFESSGSASVAEGHLSECVTTPGAAPVPVFVKVRRRFVDVLFQEEERALVAFFPTGQTQPRWTGSHRYRLGQLGESGQRRNKLLMPTFLRVPHDLDFAGEARALEFASQRFKPLAPRIRMPAVLLVRPNPNVIVMSRAPGHGATVLDWTPDVKNKGADVCELIDAFETFAQAWFEDMLFSGADTVVHTDLHLGNMMYAYDKADVHYEHSGLTILDWGQIQYLGSGISRVQASKLLSLVIGSVIGNVDMVLYAFDNATAVDNVIRRQFVSSRFPHKRLKVALREYVEHCQGSFAAYLNVFKGGVTSLFQSFFQLGDKFRDNPCPSRVFRSFPEFIMEHLQAWIGKCSRLYARDIVRLLSGGLVFGAPDNGLQTTSVVDAALGKLLTDGNARRAVALGRQAVGTRELGQLADVPGSVIREAAQWVYKSTFERVPVRVHPSVSRWGKVFAIELAYQAVRDKLKLAADQKSSLSDDRRQTPPLSTMKIAQALVRRVAIIVAIARFDRFLTVQRHKVNRWLTTPAKVPEKNVQDLESDLKKEKNRAPWVAKAQRVFGQAKAALTTLYLPWRTAIIQLRAVNAIRTAVDTLL